ncbi:MAG: LPS export ABC transporter permease LptF [Pseudomonadota bacterium]
MGRFDRYILNRVLLSFGFFSLVLVGVYWLNRAVVLLDRYLNQGQGGSLVLEITLISLPSVIQIVMPVAAYVAVIYATNRLNADSEMVVMRAAGLSAFRLARPYLVFGILTALMLSILAHAVVPFSMVRYNDIRTKLAEAISSRLIEPGNFQEPVAQVTVYVRDVGVDGKLEDVLIQDNRDPVREVTYLAQEAYLIQGDIGPQVLLFDGMAQSLDNQTRVLGTTYFDQLSVGIENVGADTTIRLVDHRELPTHILLSPPEEILFFVRREAAWLATEAHIRFAQPLFAVPAAVLGMACLLSARYSRFGLWRQILLAAILMILLKLAENAAIDLTKQQPNLWPVIYAPTLACTLIAVGLLRYSDRKWRMPGAPSPETAPLERPA